MKKNLVTSVILILVIFTLSAKPKTPAWMQDIDSEYPSEKYLAEIGHGDTQENAESDAISRIANVFETNVSTSTLTTQTVVQTNDTIEKQSTLDKRAEISSNVKLFAVNYSAPYYDKKAKTYYSVAYIDRDLAFEIFKPKIDKPAKTFSNLYDASVFEDEPLVKCKLLKQAQQSEEEFQTQYLFLKTLNPEKAQDYAGIADSLSSINSEIATLILECSMKIVVENDSANSILSAAKVAFGKEGYPISDKNAKYLVTITIDLGEQEMPAGTFYYPNVNVQVSSGNKPIAVVGKMGSKVGAKNPDVARKRAYQQIQKMIADDIITEFTTMLGSE